VRALFRVSAARGAGPACERDGWAAVRRRAARRPWRPQGRPREVLTGLGSRPRLGCLAGEPLHNLEAVLASSDIASHAMGLHLSHNKARAARARLRSRKYAMAAARCPVLLARRRSDARAPVLPFAPADHGQHGGPGAGAADASGSLACAGGAVAARHHRWAGVFRLMCVVLVCFTAAPIPRGGLLRGRGRARRSHTASSADEVRDWVVPVNRRYDLATLTATLEALFPRAAARAPRAPAADAAAGHLAPAHGHAAAPAASHSGRDAPSSGAQAQARWLPPVEPSPSPASAEATGQAGSSVAGAAAATPSRGSGEPSTSGAHSQERTLLVEYTMLHGVNDTLEDAAR
jgi:hypothetical protein